MTKSRQELATDHSFAKENIFKTKTYILSVQRYFININSGVKRYSDTGKLTNAPIVATSESDLWNPNDNADNWIMTAGKIENLRIAARRISGVVVPAGEIFSFWKYIGNPNYGKGYVVGRELREGCIVPSIGGGMCQLSNALYDAALKADFTIVERHQHTQVIEGSLAEQGRDATVKWNYIDLRFTSSSAFRIEIEMTSTKFLVRLRSDKKNDKSMFEGMRMIPSAPLNDCFSCYNTSCYICNPNEKIQNTEVVTYILDEHWREYEEYVNTHVRDNDFVLIPFAKKDRLKNTKNSWNIKAKNLIVCRREALRRVYNYKRTKEPNIFRVGVAEDEKYAKKIVKRIPIETTHIVVPLNLLPFLYENYAMGGRTFDVLLTRIPIIPLQQELDIAYKKYKNSPTLSDFRAEKKLEENESMAIAIARKLITPHLHVADLYRNKVEQLDWKINTPKEKATGKKILFPASILGRKGGYEIKKLIQELDLSILVSGSVNEYPGFTEGLKIEYINDDFYQGKWEDKVGLILFPPYIENHPTRLINAIERGVSIIATSAVGLPESENVKIVPTGDYEALKNEVVKYLSNEKNN